MAFYTILAIVHLLQGFLYMLDGTRSALNQQTLLAQIAAQRKHLLRGETPRAATHRYAALAAIGSHEHWPSIQAPAGHGYCPVSGRTAS